MMLFASLLGLVYVRLLYYFRTLTGTPGGDGIVGVMLGLFIAANPAAGFLDMYFFEREARHRFSLRWSALLWLLLNLLVLLLGWYVICIGSHPTARQGRIRPAPHLDADGPLISL